MSASYHIQQRDWFMWHMAQDVENNKTSLFVYENYKEAVEAVTKLIEYRKAIKQRNKDKKQKEWEVIKANTWPKVVWTMEDMEDK